jgi:hypothetical protein
MALAISIPNNAAGGPIPLHGVAEKKAERRFAHTNLPPMAQTEAAPSLARCWGMSPQTAAARATDVVAVMGFGRVVSAVTP